MIDASDFIAAAVQAAGPLLRKVKADQRPIIQKATEDAAYQTYLALVNPHQRETYMREARFALSTLASETALTAVRADKAVADAVASAGRVLVASLLSTL